MIMIGMIEIAYGITKLINKLFRYMAMKDLFCLVVSYAELFCYHYLTLSLECIYESCKE